MVLEMRGFRPTATICKHQCLELDASCNQEPVQGDKERVAMGPFGFAEDKSCCCILNHL